ncbi:flagellar basal body rod protein FlgC [Vagococcus penaei]|uniref:Flagellar basal-body rod protein FlgC n=1 Tax=Vagococcus penaei TaxID=633807 RepID=A0A1Q2D8B8_9ENTE|nr:flagellar basal body rod protein FlgC [Vagococcus penaei]AQP54561.1 flagellar basal body rod protein FlgC [Vagococcus penaei]RSU06727.1 flagellar basal body rod protein FlgC [Vagococcus penaei]
MSMYDSFNINASGLALERLKLDTISTNIANANTTRTENGEPYRQKRVLFEESLKNQENNLTTPASEQAIESFGVRVTGIEENQAEFASVYNPNHPDADAAGYVRMPNVTISDEMINLMNTVRTYEANVSALESSKNMMKKALEISKD